MAQTKNCKNSPCSFLHSEHLDGREEVGMEFNQVILSKIEDGMSFARSVVTFLLGFGLVVFEAFISSKYGSVFFYAEWCRIPFRVIGSVLMLMSIIYWLYSAYQIIRYGYEIFSIRSAIKETRQQWEALVTLRIHDATGQSPPKVVTDLLTLKPELLPLMEELLKLVVPDDVFKPHSCGDDNTKKSTKNSST